MTAAAILARKCSTAPSAGHTIVQLALKGDSASGYCRSKDDFTKKIQLRVNALCLLIEHTLNAGQVSDYKGYLPVMVEEGSKPNVLLAYKGYDDDFIRKDRENERSMRLYPRDTAGWSRYR